MAKAKPTTSVVTKTGRKGQGKPASQGKPVTVK